MKTKKVLINPDVVVSTLRDENIHTWTKTVYNKKDVEPCLNTITCKLEVRQNFHLVQDNIFNVGYPSGFYGGLWVYKEDFIDITEMTEQEIEEIKNKIIDQYKILKGIKDDKTIT